MTDCADCPSTTTVAPMGNPPISPIGPYTPPLGSNCCLRVRYTCSDIAGVSTWVLDAVNTACVDNAECSPYYQACDASEYTLELQDGCVCFALPTLPTPYCDPDCTTTTSSTTTAPCDPPLPCGNAGDTSAYVTGPTDTSFTCAPTFSPPAASYSYTGTIPPGTTFDAATGEVSGTVSLGDEGIYTYTVSPVSDCPNGTVEITIEIYDPATPALTAAQCFTYWTATYDDVGCTWSAPDTPYGPITCGVPPVAEAVFNQWLPNGCGALYIAVPPSYPQYCFNVDYGCAGVTTDPACTQQYPSVTVDAAWPDGPTGCECPP